MDDQGQPDKPENQELTASDIEEEIVSEDSSPIETAKPQKEKKDHLPHKKRLITLVVVALLVAVGMFVYAQKVGRIEVPAANNDRIEETPEEPLNPEEVASALQRFKNPTTGETWLPSPKKISPQGFFNLSDKEGLSGAAVTYYEVGKRGDAVIIMSLESTLGDSIYLFEKSPDGKVAAITRPDSQFEYGQNQYGDNFSPEDVFAKKVTVDRDTRYDSLSIPGELTLSNGEKVTKTRDWADMGQFIRPDSDNDAVVTKLEQFGPSEFQKITWTYPDTKLTGISYRILLPIGTEVYLGYSPLDVDAKKYTWKDAAGGVNSVYGGIMRGCGSGSGSVSRADNVKDSDFVLAGTSATGKEIYVFKNGNYELVKKAYEEFVEFNNYEESKFKDYTKEQFIKDRSLIAFKNASDEWLIYTRDDRAAVGGCAKPVVYLYPTKAQEVTVKVGADVKISDPLYDAATGWKAWAEPSGRLTVNGSSYESLFWEGPGWGRYPVIDSGTVVSRNKAAVTMQRQLRQQGLNQKEAADFMEYWTEFIPDKPYVRLTWLTNQEIDRLAPLQVLPKPDTVQRVFLDMEGLDRPINIPAQRLSSFKRNGFTVVEWGGLARIKLY